MYLLFCCVLHATAQLCVLAHHHSRETKACMAYTTVLPAMLLVFIVMNIDYNGGCFLGW